VDLPIPHDRTFGLYKNAEERLRRFVDAGHGALLQAGHIGLEKESLRVNREGGLSQKPHPPALGSALTNPYITTDYSEALLELITPPVASIGEALAFLSDAHQFVYTNLEDEVLWATSMPCILAGETNIPIARYGSSNAGMMKHVYRRGLGYRYGRVMQVIAGVHFNYSFSDAFWAAYQAHLGDTRSSQAFIADTYFGIIRNLQRIGWLIPYLFGASPAVCKSFLNGQPGQLQEFDATTFYQPYATSLRMGDIGYQNNMENEVGIKACYDSLEAYVGSLSRAISTPCPHYEKIGVVVDGEWRQLNANLLQIENEYYSTVRPKQILQDNERPTLALQRRGVRYLELRSLDINAFEPLGISEAQLHFLQLLTAFCLFSDSPLIAWRERVEIDDNEMAAAHRGREPGLVLLRGGREVTLREWALELCEALVPFCEALDAGCDGAPYSAALRLQMEAVRDPERTPSARMLAEMRSNGESFYQFARRMSEQHARHFSGRAEDPARMGMFSAQALESLQRQREIEASDTLPFDEYLGRYFA